MSAVCRVFPAQQFALACHAPGVAGQVAVAPHHAVAGHRHRQWIARACAGHGAARAGRADARCDIGIRGGLSSRNLLQRLPYPLLEGGAADIQRQCGASRGILDQAYHLCHQLLIAPVGADQFGLAEALLQRLQQRLRIVAEQDRDHAGGTAGHQHAAQRTLGKREVDDFAATTGTPLLRCHAQQPRRVFVEAPAGTEAGIVEGIGDAFMLLKPATQAIGAQRGGVLLRGQPGGLLEQAVQPGRAAAGDVGQFLQRGLVEAGLQMAADPFDTGIEGGGSGAVHGRILARAASAETPFPAPLCLALKRSVGRPQARHRGGHLTPDTTTMRLNNKIALITGASAGIGRASALRFAAEGAKLVLNARRLQPLQELAEQIRAAGGEVVVHAADVAEPGTAQALVDLARQSFGGLDIALNNAGMLGPGAPAAEFPVEAWREVMATNLDAAFHAARAQLPALLARGGGSLVFVGTFVGHTVGFPGMAAYASSKAGLIGLSQVIAAEYGPQGVRSNVLLPGGTDTDMGRQAAPTGDARDFVRSLHALKRMAEPEEIANAALFLASDESSFVTGTAMRVEGGVSITRT